MLKSKSDKQNILLKKIKLEKISLKKSEEIVESIILLDPKKLIDVDRMEINNLPDGVKVATMCSSCFLNTKLRRYCYNIQIVADIVIIYKS
jgi:hypothetical protein